MTSARALVLTLVVTLAATLGPVSVASAGAAARPKHDIAKLRGFEVGNTNRFYVEGTVSTLPKGKIRVLRNVSGGSYSLFKKVRTTGKGKFLTSITQVGRKRTCYKIQVPATDSYRATVAPVGCIENA